MIGALISLAAAALVASAPAPSPSPSPSPAPAPEVNPWQVGPAPSAHPTAIGYSFGADFSGVVGGREPLAGARVAASVTPLRRLWTGVELGHGSAWRGCVSCKTFAATWVARGLLIDRRAVHVAPWSALTFVGGTVEWTPGLAIEAGGRRIRVDTSWPLWSTWDLVMMLRATPELGVTGLWSSRHATRVAVVGVEPAIALTHRVQLDRWALTATVQVGEEGVLGVVGARFYADFLD
jgi:hypothetical protein